MQNTSFTVSRTTQKSILYLGLDPPPGAIHYPVIRTEKIGDGWQALKLWPRFSHVIFTSKTAVRYWFEEMLEFDKIAIGIGEGYATVSASEESV